MDFFFPYYLLGSTLSVEAPQLLRNCRLDIGLRPGLHRILAAGLHRIVYSIWKGGVYRPFLFHYNCLQGNSGSAYPPHHRAFLRRFFSTLVGRRAPAIGSTPHCRRRIVDFLFWMGPLQLLASPCSVEEILQQPHALHQIAPWLPAKVLMWCEGCGTCVGAGSSYSSSSSWTPLLWTLSASTRIASARTLFAARVCSSCLSLS